MTVFWLSLRSFRTQILAYGIGLGAWAAAVCFIFTTLQDTLSSIDYPQAILDAFGAGSTGLGDPRGYFSTEFFSLAPLVVGAFVVIASTGCLAGEESRGTMEMLASLPLSRLHLFVWKPLSVLVATILVLALSSAGWALALPFVEVGRDVTVWMLIGATMAQLPFLALILAVGVLLGALAPTRATAGAWTAGFLVVAYLLAAIGAISDSVSALKYASPYYYADLTGILIDGIKPWHQVLLDSITVGVVLVGGVAFSGREFGAERWQFGALLGRRDVRQVALPVPEAARVLSVEAPGGDGGRILAMLGLGLLLLAGGGGAVYGYRYLATATRVLVVDGRVDAPSAVAYAPANGVISILTASEGDDVQLGAPVGWVESSTDDATYPIVAPISGRVTRVEVRVGQLALAGTPLLLISDLGALRVSLDIDEADLRDISVGQPVDVTVTALGAALSTRIASISGVPREPAPTRASQTAKYEARCTLPNPDPRLRVGMRLKGRITIPRR